MDGVEIIPPDTSVARDRPTDSVDGQVLTGELVNAQGGRRAYVRAERFEGPLPPPKLLAEYDQVLTGLAERIAVMAEREGEHRRTMERGLLRLSGWGLFSATLIALVGVIGGIWLLYAGKTLAGLAPLLLATGSLIAVFIVNRDSPPPADTTDDEKE